MSVLLERRLRQHRARLLARAWDYRQRHHARGVWFRLRRALANAREAYCVSAQEVGQLLAEGFTAEPVGSELAPSKTILRVPQQRASRLASARPLTVSLNVDLLDAPYLVLVPFAAESPAGKQAAAE